MRRALVWAGLILALLLLGACSSLPEAAEGGGAPGVTIIGKQGGLTVVRDSLRGVTCWVTIRGGISCLPMPDSTTPAW